MKISGIQAKTTKQAQKLEIMINIRENQSIENDEEQTHMIEITEKLIKRLYQLHTKDQIYIFYIKDQIEITSWGKY